MRKINLFTWLLTNHFKGNIKIPSSSITAIDLEEASSWLYRHEGPIVKYQSLGYNMYTIALDHECILYNDLLYYIDPGTVEAFSEFIDFIKTDKFIIMSNIEFKFHKLKPPNCYSLPVTSNGSFWRFLSCYEN